MRTTFRVFAVIYSTLCSQVLSQQDPPRFELLVQRADETSRGLSVDLITLQCRDKQSGNQRERVQDVNFWFNRAAPNDPDIKTERYVVISADGMSIVFTLPRDREGNYTCGVQSNTANVEESQRVPLIALRTYFESLLLVAETRFFVASRSTAVLRCPVQPGSLYNYYYGRWSRNNTGIIEIPRPNNGIPEEINRAPGHENIDLDRRTFSLTIRSVNISRDASNNYQCILHNINPVNNMPQEFSQAASIDISLMVNEKPTIIEGPAPFIVGFQEAEANPPTFTCTIGGAPTPTLIWSYIPSLNIGENLQSNKAELLLSDGPDYSITFNTAEESNGLSLVNSTLVFLSTTNTDGGIVRCKTGRDTAFADALLTVLGTADNIDVIISRENDIIYELTFSVELQNPVTLNITYTNTRGESSSRIPNVGYNNTRTITYREIVGQLPYNVYHVSIALVGVDGGRRIMGPPTTREEIIDITKRIDPLIIIAAILGSVLGLVILVCLVPIVLFYVYKKRNREITIAEKAIEALKGLNISEQSPEELKKLVSTVDKTYRKLMLRKKHAKTDAGEDGDADPVDVLIQFLRDSFIEGFESSDSAKYIDAFDRIKDKVPRTTGGDIGSGAQGKAGDTGSGVQGRVHESPNEFPGGIIEMPKYTDSDGTATAALSYRSTQI